MDLWYQKMFTENLLYVKHCTRSVSATWCLACFLWTWVCLLFIWYLSSLCSGPSSCMKVNSPETVSSRSSQVRGRRGGGWCPHWWLWISRKGSHKARRQLLGAHAKSCLGLPGKASRRVTLGLKSEWPAGAPRGQDRAVASQSVRDAGAHRELKDCTRVPASVLAAAGAAAGIKAGQMSCLWLKHVFFCSFQSFGRWESSCELWLGCACGRRYAQGPCTIQSCLQPPKAESVEGRVCVRHCPVLFLHLITCHLSADPRCLCSLQERVCCLFFFGDYEMLHNLIISMPLLRNWSPN